MIIKCQGTAPDGTYGCSRPLGHDDHGMPCKSHAADVVWCSLCDQWECEHVNPLDVAITQIQRKIIEDARAKYLEQQKALANNRDAMNSSFERLLSSNAVDSQESKSELNKISAPRSQKRGRSWWAKLFGV
jgi:hypothetical protein